MFCFFPVIMIAQENGHKEIKAKSSAYTGDFFITTLERIENFMVTKLRITPGSYNEWHIHPDANQIMFVIDDVGYYQEECKEVLLIRSGYIITTPANKKHWNGSTPESSVTVITITGVNAKPHVEWLGKIDPRLFKDNGL